MYDIWCILFWINKQKKYPPYFFSFYCLSPETFGPHCVYLCMWNYCISVSETFSLTSTWISRSLFALRLSSYFRGTSCYNGLKYYSFGRDMAVSFSLQRQISQPACVFPKMETCKAFPKLDFWYIPQGGFKINFYMGLHYSYCRGGRGAQ